MNPLGRATAWFDTDSRDLPWRREPRDPWGVLVSEVMLQQTPVDRVVPAFTAWMDRWPTAPGLADDAPGDALRMWGRLGYPRRALRLHAAAKSIADRHRGEIPDDYDALIALPGIGDYTASAVLAFGFKRRMPVLDTNVRRVLHRHSAGRALPPSAAATRAERQKLLDSLPNDPGEAARMSEALMELGALVCTVRAPTCRECPLAETCAWLSSGRPDNQRPPRSRPGYDGSDRQVRGRIMALVRGSGDPVAQHAVESVWPDPVQLARARRSLIDDGLVVELDRARLALPS